MPELSIYDVAKAAGVHGSTVSRAFSRPDSVKTETRERILRIADELGFRVNPLGQALRRGASNLVPLIVPDITNPFYGELARALAIVVGDASYQLVLCVTEKGPEQTADFLRAMEAQFAPFAIVAPSIRLDPVLLGRSSLSERLVVLDRVPPEIDVPTVTLDNELGVKIALEHLHGLGHRRIAYLTGMVGTYSGHDRREAWIRLAPGYGMEPVVLQGGYGPEAGGRAAEAFVALAARPSAVIASNDMAAMGFQSQLALRGVHVPRDVSLIGFDGVSVGAVANPPLTSVMQPMRELAEHAVRLALGLGDGGPKEHVRLEPGLIVRSSTASPA